MRQEDFSIITAGNVASRKKNMQRKITTVKLYDCEKAN